MQEIGPRFTLKLRSLRKGLPAVKNLAERPQDLEFDAFEESVDAETKEDAQDEAMADDKQDDAEEAPQPPKKTLPPKEDQYEWLWKVNKLSTFDTIVSNVLPSPNLRRRGVRFSYRAHYTSNHYMRREPE